MSYRHFSSYPKRAVKPPPLGGGYKAHLAYASKISHNFNYGNLN